MLRARLGANQDLSRAFGLHVITARGPPGTHLSAPSPPPHVKWSVLVAVALGVVLVFVFVLLVTVALGVVLVLLVTVTLGVVDLVGGEVLLGHGCPFGFRSVDGRLGFSISNRRRTVSRMADTGTVSLPTHPCRRSDAARPAVSAPRSGPASRSSRAARNRVAPR